MGAPRSGSPQPKSPIPPAPSTPRRDVRQVWRKYLVLSVVVGFLLGLTWYTVRQLQFILANRAVQIFGDVTLHAVEASLPILIEIVGNDPYYIKVDPQLAVPDAVRKVLKPLNLVYKSITWTYCNSCLTSPPIERFLGKFESSEIRSALRAGNPGVGFHVLSNARQFLTAWTSITFRDQQWLVGISVPVEIIFYQSGAESQSRGLVVFATVISIVSLIAVLWAVRTGLEREWSHKQLWDTQQIATLQRNFAESLTDIGTALTGSLNLSEVMERVLISLRRVVPHDSSSIVIQETNLSEPTFRVAYWRHYNKQIEHDYSIAISPAMQAVFRHMVEHRLPRFIPDVETSTEWVYAKTHDWVKSYVGVPIVIQNEVIGVLNLNSGTRNFYRPEHIEMLQIFAVQAGVAIQNARLYEASQRYAADLETRVSERTTELEQRRAYFQAIVENMTDGLIYVDYPTMQISYVNPAWVSLTGFEMSRVINMPAQVLSVLNQHSEATTDFVRLFDRQITQERVLRREMTICRADGNTRDVALVLTWIFNVQGQPIGQVCLMRDISQEKALRQQRERFIADASHELRTPITSLRLRMYLAANDKRNPEKHFAVMEHSIGHLNRLMDDLLDVTRLQGGRIKITPEKAEISELVRMTVETHQPHAAEKHIDLQVSLPEKPLLANVDKTRLTQVVDNLIANALNYTSNGGTIRVTLEQTKASETNPQLLISVQDTGVGIPEHALPHLFEPFYRVPNSDSTVRGSGLGLTICREIIERHNGTIRVESQLGVGSTFIVAIPL